MAGSIITRETRVFRACFVVFGGGGALLTIQPPKFGDLQKIKIQTRAVPFNDGLTYILCFGTTQVWPLAEDHKWPVAIDGTWRAQMDGGLPFRDVLDVEEEVIMGSPRHLWVLGLARHAAQCIDLQPTSAEQP